MIPINKDLKAIVLTFLFVLVALAPIQSALAQFACVPKCPIDARFMVLSGADFETNNNTDAFFHITSLPGSTDIEIGIYDGNSRWDSFPTSRPPDPPILPPFNEIEFTLFFDPSGTGLGIGNGDVYRTWTSDGSFGDNMGSAMPDADWFVQVLPNDPQAQTAVGSYSYALRAVNLFPAIVGANVFKIRSDGTVSIPAGEAFNYTATFRFFEDLMIVYPNFIPGDPTCFNPLPTEIGGFGIRGFCDPTDPDCCIHETTNDGSWEFVFNVPDNITTLDIWDGDLDYGSASANADASACNRPDFVVVDTDDPTPIPLPSWD